ncbi:MAG: DUF3047 domain-containing protein [Ramlibacter sp.]|nr:DUF3047 domain-containing protein [Ramlibacter sp.]
MPAPAVPLAFRGAAELRPDPLRRALLGVPSVVALTLAGGCASVPPELPKQVAPFSTARELGGLPRGWEEVVMRRDLPLTDYRLAELDGRRVLRASGRGASGLRCRLHVDPQAVPWMRWSWRTREVPPGMNVQRGATDDSPARTVVAFHGEESLLSLRDRAVFELVHLITGQRLPYATLMYVWDAQLPVGTVVNYARTSRIRYLVVESGRQRAGRWLWYERNLVEDFRRVFGEEPGWVDSVGLMTDGDDLKVAVETWYGDIRLEARP